jgi:hypothetical protein
MRVGKQESAKAGTSEIHIEISMGRVLGALEGGDYSEAELERRRKQWKRNRTAFTVKDVPAYPTIASQFDGPVPTWMSVNLCRLKREKGEE